MSSTKALDRSATAATEALPDPTIPWVPVNTRFELYTCTLILYGMLCHITIILLDGPRLLSRILRFDSTAFSHIGLHVASKNEMEKQVLHSMKLKHFVLIAVFHLPFGRFQAA